MIREYFGIRWEVISPSLFQAASEPRVKLEFVQDHWYLYASRTGAARQFPRREDALRWLSEMAEERGIVL